MGDGDERPSAAARALVSRSRRDSDRCREAPEDSTWLRVPALADIGAADDLG